MYHTYQVPGMSDAAFGADVSFSSKHRKLQTSRKKQTAKQCKQPAWGRKVQGSIFLPDCDNMKMLYEYTIESFYDATNTCLLVPGALFRYNSSIVTVWLFFCSSSGRVMFPAAENLTDPKYLDTKVQGLKIVRESVQNTQKTLKMTRHYQYHSKYQEIGILKQIPPVSSFLGT